MAGVKNKKNFVFSLLFLFYVGVLLRITVFRTGFTLEPGAQRSVNLALFSDLLHVLREESLFTFLYLFLGNILWFVPFGAYLAHKHPALSLWALALWGFGASLLVEALQYAFAVGVFEIDDLILNTLGTLAGALIIKQWGKAKSSSL